MSKLPDVLSSHEFYASPSLTRDCDLNATQRVLRNAIVIKPLSMQLMSILFVFAA